MKKLNRASIAFKVITVVSAVLNLAAAILYIIFAVIDKSSTLYASYTIYDFISQYGPYFIMGLGALVFAAVVVMLILQQVIKNKEKKFADAAAAAVSKLPDASNEPKEPEELTYSGVIKQRLTAIKVRLDVLDEVKDSGVLTANEYQQKRTEIIDELKI